MSRFIMKKGNDKHFYFQLTAPNGLIILNCSEGYKSREACMSGISMVARHAASEDNYKRETALNGLHYFTIHSEDGERAAMSEMYNSAQGRDHGIEAVKANAPIAIIEDIS